jgi:phospholipid transport system substrate-binding protein
MGERRAAGIRPARRLETEQSMRAFHRTTWHLATVASLLAVAFSLWLSPRAQASDPAVQFLQKVGRELLTASRSRSPDVMASVVQRYGDVGYIANYALGTYRGKLAPEDRTGYTSGMVRFIGRYSAQQAPKYPVARYEILSSVQGGTGTMVDSRIHMHDGTTYEVRWLLAKYGTTYRVRDAMVFGFWMTPFLKQLFENYIVENGGNVKALVAVLTR